MPVKRGYSYRDPIDLQKLQCCYAELYTGTKTSAEDMVLLRRALYGNQNICRSYGAVTQSSIRETKTSAEATVLLRRALYGNQNICRSYSAVTQSSIREPKHLQKTRCCYAELYTRTERSAEATVLFRSVSASIIIIT